MHRRTTVYTRETKKKTVGRGGQTVEKVCWVTRIKLPKKKTVREKKKEVWGQTLMCTTVVGKWWTGEENIEEGTPTRVYGPAIVQPGWIKEGRGKLRSRKV